MLDKNYRTIVKHFPACHDKISFLHVFSFLPEVLVYSRVVLQKNKTNKQTNKQNKTKQNKKTKTKKTKTKTKTKTKQKTKQNKNEFLIFYRATLLFGALGIENNA